MTITEGFQPATEQWDAFALALAAPLGPFAQVHLAPKFPPALLNAALATYLPLQEDELLLAMIDRGGQKLTGRCALTTRRIYWTETDQEREPASDRGSSRTDRSQRRDRFVVRIADYADLPDHIEVDRDARTDRSASTSAGGATIELGRDRRQAGVGSGTLSRNNGDAARAGAAPEGLIDPELAARAARACRAWRG